MVEYIADVGSQEILLGNPFVLAVGKQAGVAEEDVPLVSAVHFQTDELHCVLVSGADVKVVVGLGGGGGRGKFQLFSWSLPARHLNRRVES
jgi:hypothetical protein